MRRYYGVDPDLMTEDEWLKLYAEFKFTERQRAETNALAYKQALAEVLTLIFGDEQQNNTMDS